MTPTREILWNVSHISNTIVMYALFAISVVIGVVGVLRHAEIWVYGKPDNDRNRSWMQRAVDLYTWGLFQQGVVRERVPAVAHTLIYAGFLVLTFATTMVLIDHDLGIRIYQGNFYLGVTFLSDVLGFGALLGCMVLAHRRYLTRPDFLHTRSADGLMLNACILMIVQGFILEGLRIHATEDPWALYSPIGYLVAKFFWALPPTATRTLHFIMWWFHAATVFALFAVAPYTKFFHIIASSANLYFRFSQRHKGALSFPGDIEKMVEKGDEFSIGTASIKDYSWKQLLDLDACTSCGRCQDNCPAYISGKPLSPKWLILDSRNHMLALHADGKLTESKIPQPLSALDSFLTKNLYLSSSGVSQRSDGTGYDAQGAFRGKNSGVQTNVLALGNSADDKMSGTVLNEDLFWSCTTCMACVQVCPVGINHVDHIVENRRNMVVMEGKIPHEAQKTLRALENRQNPYGDPADRIKWIEGLDVKILSPGDSVDYLYWVGCVSAFDPRKQKIARSLVTLMKAAGLSFGILGTAEGCTGDPARRLGEENLFQTLAKMNIETLKSVQFKTLVANCPHCFNTIKHEYPQLGNLGEGRSPEIIHHSQLLKRLLKDGSLTIKNTTEAQYTFHDPCYLGRYNDEYDAPREIVSKSSRLPIIEMDRSREKAMCCGAGGGHFWMDMKVGERVNTLRVEQAAATGAEKIATGCPFCMQMMEDGVKLTNREGAVEVKDIAEVLAEQI
jgi:Fe-S oxidoreductase